MSRQKTRTLSIDSISLMPKDSLVGLTARERGRNAVVVIRLLQFQNDISNRCKCPEEWSSPFNIDRYNFMHVGHNNRNNNQQCEYGL